MRVLPVLAEAAVEAHAVLAGAHDVLEEVPRAHIEAEVELAAEPAVLQRFLLVPMPLAGTMGRPVEAADLEHEAWVAELQSAPEARLKCRC